MRKNLVVVRAGDKSLHPQWLDDGRDFDLFLSYYGDYLERYISQYDFFHSYKGSKWQGLNQLVNSFDFEKFLNSYEYVWFPDDDILTNASDINIFFGLCKKYKFSICQPSLTLRFKFEVQLTVTC